MLNQSIIVGSIVDSPKFRETEDGTKVADITLEVQRTTKNERGEYDVDFIPCVLWKGVAETTAEYCQKGDLIGVRGRIQTFKNNDDKTEINVVAERVTFLSSKKMPDKEEIDAR